jgi:hypothetical protein
VILSIGLPLPGLDVISTNYEHAGSRPEPLPVIGCMKFLQICGLPDDINVPGLKIYGRGSNPAGLQDQVQLFLFHGTGIVFTTGIACLRQFDKVI